MKEKERKKESLIICVPGMNKMGRDQWHGGRLVPKLEVSKGLL